MKTKTLLLLVFAGSFIAHASDIEITSLASNGRLTWTNSFTNGLFSIEWAPAMGTNWHNNWNSLQNFWVSGRTNTVDVPMFYRVKCETNLLMPTPVGSQVVLSVSNALGNVWTQQVQCLGYVRPSAAGTNDYALFAVVTHGSMSMALLRSTDTQVFWLDPCSLTEELNWQIAPVGTTWTNFNHECQYTLKVSVDAIEDVTVPAGTFTSCYKFHTQALSGSSSPTPYYYEWIKPGFGTVKWVDYWTDNGPDVYELQSWSVPTP